MICDAHVHIGYWPWNGKWLYYSPRRICGVLARCGISEFVAASTTSQVAEITELELHREALEMKKYAGTAAHIFYWLTGRRYDADKNLSHLSDEMYEGIKLHCGETPWSRQRPSDLSRIIDYAYEHKKKIMFHCGEKDGCSPKDFANWAARHLAVKFNFAHCRPVKEMLAVMRDLPNVYTDVSFLPSSDLEYVVSSDVADRIMYGSDTPIPFLKEKCGLSSALRRSVREAMTIGSVKIFNAAFRKFLA